nr:2-dehydropantoate 2-reductase [Streptomyces boncukensis]
MALPAPGPTARGTGGTGATGATGHRTVAVLGPGGVGGLLAALLARAGHRVLCLAGEDTARALRTDGLRVRSGHCGDFTARVEADTALREPVDLCLVTVKHTALEAALDRLPAGVLGDAPLVPLLNGVDHLAALRRRYGAGPVVPATVKVESTRTAPGVIEHGSPFVQIELAGAEERLGPLAALFTDAGAEARVVPDEAGVMWAKLAFLAPVALLTTRYRATIGAVRTERRDELVAVLEEAAAVARACGASVDPAAVLERCDAFPAGNKSSMLRDAEAGRELELDAIGGALLRAAEERGVPVPTAARLVAELEASG